MLQQYPLFSFEDFSGPKFFGLLQCHGSHLMKCRLVESSAIGYALKCACVTGFMEDIVKAHLQNLPG